MNINEVIDIISKEKPYLEKEYGVKSIGIFGSLVRGEECSDIDILVDFSKSLGLLKFVNLEHHLEDLLQKDIDLVMRSALKPRVGDRILSEVHYL